MADITKTFPAQTHTIEQLQEPAQNISLTEKVLCIIGVPQLTGPQTPPVLVFQTGNNFVFQNGNTLTLQNG